MRIIMYFILLRGFLHRTTEVYLISLLTFYFSIYTDSIHTHRALQTHRALHTHRALQTHRALHTHRALQTHALHHFISHT
jgi:hypothetical protein